MIHVEVDNFQSIKHGEMDIDGFTLVVGETSAGKSATIRAISAATSNRFRAGMVRNGEKELAVTLSADGHTYTAKKKDGGSTTMVYDGSVFEKTGRDIPEAIDNFLNLGRLDVGADKFSLNICPQFQKPLLLEFSQKKVVDILSSSKGLDDLKYVQEQVGRSKSEVNGGIKAVARLVDEYGVKLEAATNALNKESGLHDEIVDLCNKVDVCYANVDFLTSLLESYRGISEKDAKLRVLRQYLSVLEQLHTENEKVSQIKELTRLRRNLDTLHVKGKTITDFNGVLTSLSDASHKKSTLESLMVVMTRIKDIVNKGSAARAYYNVIESIKGLAGKADMFARALTYWKSIKVYEKEITRLQSVADGEICPLCGHKLK